MLSVDQEPSPKVQITRRTLAEIIINSKCKTFEKKFENVVEFVEKKTFCPTQSRQILLAEVRHFKQQFKNKWLSYNRHKERFFSNEKAWLDAICEFTSFSSSVKSLAKGGRPLLDFAESSENSKRRKTAELRAGLEADVLVYAAQMKLRACGKSTEAQAIKKIADTPEYANDILNVPTTTKFKQLSPQEALSLLIEAQLSRTQYETIRNYAKDIFPSYKAIQSAKQDCYPENIEVTETEALVPLQPLLDHTATRLLQVQQNVLQCKHISPSDKMTLHSKWGFDGSSSHTQYKQKFVSEDADDKYMFLTCLVPLRLTYEKDGKTFILWQNPKPSSPRFCRPISLQYLKETDDLVKRQKSILDEQIKMLRTTTIELDGYNYIVEHNPIFTMVDGKLCNSLADNNSTMRCYLCDATSKDFNDLREILKRPVKSDFLSFGLSVLHSWIRLFESILHIAYKLPVRAWRVNKENKQIVQENKTRIQKEFREKMSLIVDKPKPGFGNSNDGNVARGFFQSYEASAAITGIDKELIRKLYIILQTISSGFKINIEKFKYYCLDTASLYITLYPWMPMTPTLHKILIHGPEIINLALLPIGQLSEEAQEARNKDFKSYREHFSRKTSRIDNITDIFNRLLISSDPFITSMRNISFTIKRKTFDDEVINMLAEEVLD